MYASAFRLALVLTALLGLALLAGDARATYSIIALDVDTGQLGGAGTSCVGSQSVYAIYGVVPGVGVVAAQAALNEVARDRAVMMLEQGASAAEVIADITNADFDLLAGIRQYAVIDVESATPVGFTGASTMVYADDVQGNVVPYVYSVQGNILTSAAVLDQARAVFTAPGCDLADTLMLALEAGAQNDEGDSRCTPDGIPSDGAFIEVNLPDQGTAEPFLYLEVSDTSPSDPLAELRAMYTAWRTTHPCPEPPPSNADAGVISDAGIEDAGTIDVPAPQAGSMALPPAGGAGASAGSGGVSGTAAAGAGATGGASGQPQPPVPPPMTPMQSYESDASGCAIARGPRRSHSGSWLLVLAAVLAIMRPWYRAIASTRLRTQARRARSPAQ
jgi:uncharacterized Ntn-hydrolase superfamily protein